jgi:hypothetical protein
MPRESMLAYRCLTQSIRRLCEVFGDLEDLQPWTETQDKGFEAVFYDRDCALRALWVSPLLYSIQLERFG